jgi:hypothetical protein
MTTRTLTGSYSSGYTLNASYSALVATTTASVGGIGIVADTLATVTNSGAVAAAAAAAGTEQHAGILLSAGGEVVNFGAVAGGVGSVGIAYSYDGDPGGNGVDIASGSITNYGTITGGQGGAAGKSGGFGGSGGNGVYLSGASSVTNAAGTISGGAGGGGALSAGGAGLCALENAQLANSSVIVGGAGGGGHGGYGIEFLGVASITNTGTVIGGAGVGVYRGGPGAYLLEGGTIDNSGEIVGGAGGATSPGGASSASGVIMARHGTLTNIGTVAGGAGALGAGVILLSGGVVANGDTGHTDALVTGYDGVQFGGAGTGSLSNAGTIEGTGAAGGYGLELGVGDSANNGSDVSKTALIEGWTGAFVPGSSTLTNYGTIEGGGGLAVSLGASTATLVAEAQSAFEGEVVGGGGTLVLASGAGTLSGLGGGDVTVSTSMPTTSFNDFGSLELDSATRFTLSGNGTISSGDTLIDAGILTDGSGATLTAAGTLSGAGTLALTGGAATFEAGSDLAVAKVTQSRASMASLDAAGLTYTGAWFQTSGTLTAAGGDRVNFTGTGNSFEGTLAGAGTIAFVGGSDAFTGAHLTGASVVSGATVTLSGALGLSGTMSVTSDDLTIAGVGASLAGGGALIFSNLASNAVSGGTLTNVNDYIKGAGQLGDGSMVLVNDKGGIIDGDDSVALTIDTGSSTILNAGRIEAAGEGGAIVAGAIDNTGVLGALGGSLTVDGAVTGTGAVEIKSATADFTSSFSQDVTFSGAYGELVLAQSQGFSGTIAGFSKTGATAIDLEDIAFTDKTTASYSGTATSGVLTVSDGTHTARITLTGDYLGSTFDAFTDGHGGTTVVDPPKSADAGQVASTHRFIAAIAGFGVGVGVAHEPADGGRALVQPMLASSR